MPRYLVTVLTEEEVWIDDAADEQDACEQAHSMVCGYVVSSEAVLEEEEDEEE